MVDNYVVYIVAHRSTIELPLAAVYLKIKFEGFLNTQNSRHVHIRYIPRYRHYNGVYQLFLVKSLLSWAPAHHVLGAEKMTFFGLHQKMTP